MLIPVKKISDEEITRDKVGHYIIKGSIYQEGIAILSICASETKTSKYMKQKLKQLKYKQYHIYS